MTKAFRDKIIAKAEELGWNCTASDENEEVFRYQLLSRMKMDCEFFLGFGNRMEKYLWAGSVAFQIECMKSIRDSFPADGKPEWLTVEQIENYERRMAE